MFIVDDNDPIEYVQGPPTPVIDQSYNQQDQSDEDDEENFNEIVLGSDDDAYGKYSSEDDNDSTGSLKDFIVEDDVCEDDSVTGESDENYHNNDDKEESYCSEDDTDTENNENMWESGEVPPTMETSMVGTRRSTRIRRPPQRYMDPNYKSLMLDDIDVDDIDDILSD